VSTAPRATRKRGTARLREAPAAEPVLTLEAFLETPESFWERMRQQPAWREPTPFGEPHPALGPLTPEDRDALLQWRTAALRAVEGTMPAKAESVEDALVQLMPSPAAEMLHAATMLPRVEGGRGLFFLSYSAALAWRYIQESGATLESVASWTWGEWDMAGEFIVRPSGPTPLARADGTAATPWEEWLAVRAEAGWENHFSALLAGLRRIAEGVREATFRREKEAAEAAAAAAQAALEVERKKLRDAKAGLRDTVALPQQLVHSGWDATHRHSLVRSVARRNDQGELFATVDDNGYIRQYRVEEDAVLSMPSFTTLGRIDPWQVRALMGVYRVMTSASEASGTAFLPFVELPFLTFCRAAGLDGTARQQDRERLFTGARRLARTIIPVARRLRNERGEECVALRETPPFSLESYWDVSEDKRRGAKGRKGITPEHAAELMERATHNPETEWEGPLPSRLVIRFDDVLRLIQDAVYINANVVEMLDGAAKKVRGRSERFDGLEWRLFMECVRTRQPKDGRSYVEREAVLVDYFGKDQVEREARKRGRTLQAKRGVFAEYRKAVDVLKEAGLVEVVALDHQAAKKGKGGSRLRDVFRLTELAYSSERAAVAGAPDPSQMALLPAEGAEALSA
jgi:hypothetical protein